MTPEQTIGLLITDPRIDDVDYVTAYPVIDRATLKIIGLVDANYPEEYNDGLWVTGALVDGKIVTGPFHCDFAVTVDSRDEVERGI